MSPLKPLLISSGEPSGVGPDLCLALAGSALPVVVLGDKDVLEARKKQLGWSVVLEDYQPHRAPTKVPNHLTVLSIPCPEPVVLGMPNSKNAPYVMRMLEEAVVRCQRGEFSALITAPVHKAIINQAGIIFTGHTEFLANACHCESVVMLLASDTMKVALVTTHLPLRKVADALTPPLIIKVITKLNLALKHDFGIVRPKIFVAGLNPHAGELGYLGHEEIDIISPALNVLKQQGIDVHGPYSADTLFIRQEGRSCDAYVAMYHDQALPVLKYASFGRAVNVTLGLPFIRTSVDHGTALELAGTGQADAGSLKAAVEMAAVIYAHRREKANDND